MLFHSFYLNNKNLNILPKRRLPSPPLISQQGQKLRALTQSMGKPDLYKSSQPAQMHMGLPQKVQGPYPRLYPPSDFSRVRTTLGHMEKCDFCPFWSLAEAAPAPRGARGAGTCPPLGEGRWAEALPSTTAPSQPHKQRAGERESR